MYARSELVDSGLLKRRVVEVMVDISMLELSDGIWVKAVEVWL